MPDIAGVAQTAFADAGLGVLTSIEPPEMLIFDPLQDRAPTAIQVTIANAEPSADFEFTVGAEVVHHEAVDVDGNLDLTSISINDLDAGEYTLTATSGTTVTTATFTLARDAIASELTIGEDADPILLPASIAENGRFHWVFQDLMPGGVGSWVMPIGPASMTSPHGRKSMTVEHTTSPNEGTYLATEGIRPAVEWQFSGYCPNLAFYEQLITYAELNRRFYVIDFRGRAWTVAATNLDFKLRKRQREDDGTFQDGAGDYTFSAVIVNDPKEPV